MRKSLVALDTPSLKDTLFQTNTLQGVRGASSLVDRLNRVTMRELARDYAADLIYACGGAGLFLVDGEKAEAFGKGAQRAFWDGSQGGFSLTYAVQPLSPHVDREIEELMGWDVRQELELMRYALHEAEGHPRTVIALPAYPLFRPCEVCGLRYAQEESAVEDRHFYCTSCKERLDEDTRQAASIERTVKRLREGRGRAGGGPQVSAGSDLPPTMNQDSLWERLLVYLEQANYKDVFDHDGGVPERPHNLGALAELASPQGYVGLICANVNAVQVKMEALTSLTAIREVAFSIDDAIHAATSAAIARHLPVLLSAGHSADTTPLFPFDVLLLGGDEVMMVTDAARAMDVALTIAQEFRRRTNNEHAVAAGVVLAPAIYPFSVLAELAESTLKFAKKKSAALRLLSPGSDDSAINFMTVAGDGLNSFDAVYNRMYRKVEKEAAFYATLRPYTLDELKHLLDTIRLGRQLNLDRARLQQLRRAVTNMNLTHSVAEGLAVLRNWQEEQRTFIVSHVYQFGGLYQLPRNNASDPVKGFPRVTFPWFADTGAGGGTEEEEQAIIYRTSLLDFIELYDFVGREGGGAGGKN